jgi:hypothetical protein
MTFNLKITAIEKEAPLRHGCLITKDMEENPVFLNLEINQSTTQM